MASTAAQKHTRRFSERSAPNERANASSRQPVTGLRHVGNSQPRPHCKRRLGREEIYLTRELPFGGTQQPNGSRTHRRGLVPPRANEANELERTNAAVCRRRLDGVKAE